MNISQSTVKELLNYNKDSGLLIWKFRPRSYFKRDQDFITWNNRFQETPALNGIDPTHGYRCGSLLGRRVFSHRVIWLWMTGIHPQQIDHKNQDRSDNSWQNLRNVSHLQNGRNQKKNAKNTSGYHGVWWNKKRNTWNAEIKVNQKKIHLGVFKDKDDAIESRLKAERKYNFYRNHGAERD